MTSSIILDPDREARIGLTEAIYCSGKSLEQICDIVRMGEKHNARMLFTRLEPAVYNTIASDLRSQLRYDPVSQTASLGDCAEPAESPDVVVVSAGASDFPVGREAVRTLAFHGQGCTEIYDVGVAGIHRLFARLEPLQAAKVVIVVAGHDGALFSVIAGLVSGLVIAVPTATGYGVAADGTTALYTALASCAPGLVVVNIGNGFGAACAALRGMRC